MPGKTLQAANWMSRHWRAGLAFIYSVVVVFDFIIAPAFVGLTRVDLFELILLIDHLPVDLQREIIHQAYSPVTPYTLQGSGLFHLSFGALLTGAAVTGKKTE